MFLFLKLECLFILIELDLLQKKTFHYVEASKKKQQQYLEEIKDIDPNVIVYSDETGIDDNEVPPRGWAPRGQRLHAKKKGIRVVRLNITAALNQGKIIAPFIFEGYSNASVYEAYIEQVLVPCLKPGMVLVIDNARFHKSAKIERLIKDAGCKIIYLPPYTPEFNPIEQCWSPIKARIRRAAETFTDFYEAAVHVLGEMCAS
jgi:transposase